MSERRPSRSRGRAARAGAKNFDTAYLVVVFAIAVAVTPEFTLLGIPKVRLTDVLLPVILAATLSSLVTTNQRIGSPPLLPMMGAVVLWNACVLLAFGSGHLTSGIQYLGKRIIYFLIYLMGVCLVRTREGYERSIWSLIAAAPLLCYTILQDLRTLEGPTDIRASGVIQDQESSTALFLVLVLALILGVWPGARKVWQRGLLSLALISVFASILATGSKMGLILSVAVAVPLVVAAARRAPEVVVIAVITGVVGVALTPDALLERFNRIQHETSNTFQGLTKGEEYMGQAGSDSLADRYYAAKYALKYQIPKAPIFGQGMAAKSLGTVDNCYITEWLYNGLVGLVLWLGLILVTLLAVWRARRDARDPLEAGVALACFVSVLAYALAGLTADSFYLIRPMEGLMLVVGLVIGCQRLYEGEPMRPPVRRFVRGRSQEAVL